MSLKNRDNKNRWRNKTVAFRVSPEEDEQIEAAVRLSGLTKQDYITRRLLEKDVVVIGANTKAEIWDRARWEALNAAWDPREMLQTLEEIGF